MSEVIYLKKSDQKVPRPTEKDNNKILSVVDGKPAWVPVTDFVQSSVPLKDVNFYDYDGKVVASYSLEEAQNLTSLPEAPAHKSLIFQGWNWNLDDINTLTNPMNIGAIYTTDDGKTRLYISIYDDAVSTISLCFSQTKPKGVTIYWGDGTVNKTISATGSIKTNHTYARAGAYAIELSVSDGCVINFNNSVFGSDKSKPYGKILQYANIGKSVASIGLNAFNNCHSLTSITIPNGVQSIYNSAFYSCYSLTSIMIPNSVTSINSNAFFNCISLSSISIPSTVYNIYVFAFCQCYSLTNITIPNSVTKIVNNIFYNCYSLTNITIPNSVTSIGSNAFSNCYSLTSITIPNSVTSIESKAFNNCSGIVRYHLRGTTPPTLSATDAFTGIFSKCIIYVPKGCLEAYQTATNWSYYSSYMQEEVI